VLDLESLNPEEIKLALITDVERLVRMFFDQEKEQLNRETAKVNRAIQLIKDIQSDIEDYQNYREESIKAIRGFYQSLLNSGYFKNETRAAEKESDESLKKKKKAKELKEEIETFLNKSNQEDKEILSLGRKIENSYGTLGIYFSQRWYIGYFKEYVSKVRKTERTILKPKGCTIESDLSNVLESYKLDKEAIRKKAELYKGENKSPRWGTLHAEIEEKKSALHVEGKTSEYRASEFAKLNYLLAYKAEDVNITTNRMLPPSTESHYQSRQQYTDLELEALALELELALLTLN
jgi:hypothetical protein